jgi:N-acylneuraminate cytidylyltransferase
MIAGQTVLGIIPARGGSKTVPHKNLKPLAGKPLIAWTIEAAQKSQYIDRLILSSEDPHIIKAASELGCEVPFVRPIELAWDDTPGILPVIHAIEALQERYNYVVVLQPTSPLRTTADIDECISYCVQHQATTCISVAPVTEHPYWMYTLTDNHRLAPLIQMKKSFERRQDLPAVFSENGAVYIAQADYLLKEKSFINDLTLAYIMPVERSIDIDNEIDIQICSFLKGIIKTNPS